MSKPIYGDITIHAHDHNDLVRQLQARSRRDSMAGPRTMPGTNMPVMLWAAASLLLTGVAQLALLVALLIGHGA